MKTTYALIAASLLLCCSCTKKKHAETIIIDKPIVVEKKTTKLQQEVTHKEVVNWGGNEYTISLFRSGDKTLPLVKDENGREYYDNTVKLEVTRADGSQFCSHLFTKAYLEKYCTSEWAKHGSLIGVAFRGIEDQHLIFSASVGSPDELSDQFEPLKIKVSRFDDITVERDNLEE